MNAKEELKEKIADIVWISRWSENGESLSAVLRPDEYIDIENKLIELFNHKTQELQNEVERLKEENNQGIYSGGKTVPIIDELQQLKQENKELKEGLSMVFNHLEHEAYNLATNKIEELLTKTNKD